MNGAGFSWERVGLIAGNTLRDARRQRVVLFVGVLGLVLVVVVQGLRELNFGSSELKFLADFGFGALALFGAVLAITATTQLFFAEIEQRTVLTVLAKPVRRSEFLLGKFAGVSAVLAGYCAIMTALVGAMLAWRAGELAHLASDGGGRSLGWSVGGVVAAGAAQWLRCELLAALTLLVATFARTQLFAVATGFLVMTICHLQFFARTTAERGGGLVARIFGRGLAVLFPDFQVFDLTDRVGGGVPVWGDLGRLSAHGVVYAAAVLALAAYSFRKREL